MRQPLAINPKRTALLLIDLQEEQRVGPDYIVEDLAEILANAQKLLEAARGHDLLVIHAAYKRDFNKVPRRALEHTAADGGPAFSDIASPLTAICREVAPRDGETVLHKNDASAFGEGELTPLLRAGSIEWLVICGVWTEACVAATVRDAIAQGIRVLLVKDACGSGTRAMHQIAILNLANRLYGGAVADTATAVRLMAGNPTEAWSPEKPVPILFRYEDAERHFNAL